MSIPNPPDSRPHSTDRSPADVASATWGKRPSLTEILSDSAPPPWTLSAFTAYCSQNLCLENIEFTIDTRRYEKLYSDFAAQSSDSPASPDRPQSDELTTMWNRIMHHYIIPSGPREVNIPGDIRDELLAVPEQSFPPAPDYLRPAIRKIHELMEDSILQNFLNEVRPYAASPEPSDVPAGFDYRKHRRSVPTIPNHHLPSRSTVPASYGSSGNKNTNKHPQSFQNMIRPSASQSTQGSHGSGGSGSGGEYAIGDDKSIGSPTPTTDYSSPPASPPMSDVGSRATRTKSETSWKRMGVKLGLRKRSDSQSKHDRDSNSPET